MHKQEYKHDFGDGTDEPARPAALDRKPYRVTEWSASRVRSPPKEDDDAKDADNGDVYEACSLILPTGTDEARPTSIPGKTTSGSSRRLESTQFVAKQTASIAVENMSFWERTAKRMRMEMIKATHEQEQFQETLHEQTTFIHQIPSLYIFCDDHEAPCRW
ncbi:hypothetical protein H257_08045 [Aphanomyces astaci]|uniref:Uncharacterized protein n=1 Tax=Aphanomyces astaci TaxID=112090 RepID=W4GFR5_APHAT|nr:hypothetical protein H257_08045 [Aphanomyces astaci]ETV78532.1 hypothetical protein H257_08045 [Aphanomyces astaci]|eukprot:XP_009832113.1 hypothetical protein H257_08045 [Aphanomyces astaci]